MTTEPSRTAPQGTPPREERRRRGSRRRKHRRKSFAFPKRRVISALVLFVIAATIAAALPTLRRLIAGSPWAASIQPEWIALGIASLGAVWLMPGVEDRVLQRVGLKKPPRKNRRRDQQRFSTPPARSVEDEEGA